MRRSRLFLAILAPLLVLGPLVWAGIDVEAYQEETTTSAYRSGLSGADNVDQSHATVLALTQLTVASCPTYEISGRFSTASATVIVHFNRYEDTGGTLTLQSSSEATLTADATILADGTLYVSEPLFFDTTGSEKCIVTVEAPSAGTVDLWARKVGLTR